MPDQGDNPHRIIVALGTVLLIALVVVLALLRLNGGLILRNIQDAATSGAETEKGVGKVIGVTYRPVTESNPIPSAMISIQLNGELVTANTTTPPRIGDSVTVQYQRGRTGQVYVERILPK